MSKRRDWGSGSITQRSKGHWRVTVDLGRDPVTGKRRRRRFTVKGTKRDALKALNDAISERDHGGVVPNRITTTEWLNKCIAERVADKKISPLVEDNYRTIVRLHLDPSIGSVLLQDLRADHIRALKEKLVKSHSPATAKRILGLLRQALNAAVTQELLTRSPALAVSSPALDRGGSERRALDESEITELLQAAAGTRHEMVIRCALATGMRQGELLGAEWTKISLERGEWEVAHSLQRVNGEFRLANPKTPRSHRTIELSDTGVEVLEKHRANQNAERRRMGPAWKDHGLVFPDERGGYWDRMAFYKGYRRLVDRSPIENPWEIKFHSLRHTAASQWIKAGVDLLTVSRRLGHAKASFTLDVYGHLLTGQQDAAAKALDHLIGWTPSKREESTE